MQRRPIIGFRRAERLEQRKLYVIRGRRVERAVATMPDRGARMCHELIGPLVTPAHTVNRDRRRPGKVAVRHTLALFGIEDVVSFEKGKAVFVLLPVVVRHSLSLT